MNSLFIRIENSTWQSKTPSAIYFDDLIDLIGQNIIKELRWDFHHTVLFPLEELYKKKYISIVKPDSEGTELEFKFQLPLELIINALPALNWFLRNFPNEKRLTDTAKDLIEACGRAEKIGSDVLIWGD